MLCPTIVQLLETGGPTSPEKRVWHKIELNGIRQIVTKAKVCVYNVSNAAK